MSSGSRDTQPKILEQPEKPRWMESLLKAKAAMAVANAKKPMPYSLPMEAEAPKVAAAIREEVAPKGKLAPEQGWINFAPIPRDLCRCSPFFPLNRNQLKLRAFLEELVVAQSSWGTVTYTGPRLSIYEEDVLLAVLAVLDAQHRPETITEDGKRAFTYKGPIRPLIQALGYSKPSKAEYTRFRRALRLLMATAMEINTKAGSWATTNIVAAVFGKGENISITVNPYFHEMYGQGAVTLLDVPTRLKLSGQIARAMHRFICSHRDLRWQGHFLTLAGALNVGVDAPHFEIRRQLKTAITALVKAGVLEARTSGIKGDIVTLTRVKTTLESRSQKSLPAG